MGFEFRPFWGKKDAVVTTEIRPSTALEERKPPSLKERYQRFKLLFLDSRVVRVSFFTILAALSALLIIVLVYTQTRRRRGGSHLSSKFVHTPIQPPSYPLAVRSPYLSAWMPGTLVANLPYYSPQFWTGAYLGWSIMARVDNVTYSLMGVPEPANGTIAATVLKGVFTSTYTNFTLKAGDVDLTLEFLSPVSPSNYLRQSLPFSYLTITVSNTDRKAIQVYTDIDTSWTGQYENTIWNFTSTTNTSMLSMSAVGRSTYSEMENQALWGDVILASRSSNVSTLSYQTGDSAAVRQAFASAGDLTGAVPDWTANGVMAMAQDIPKGQDHAPVIFAIGYVREDAINFMGQPYTGYYRSVYPDTIDAVSYFLDDFTAASAEAFRLDDAVTTATTSVAGTNYSDIVTLSVRQAYAGVDLVVPSNTTDPSEVLGFVKEISSDGNVNTLDVIFPMLPMFWSMEPNYIRLFLDPVLIYLASGAWKKPYTIHDLGAHYPNATGHDNQIAEPMPTESTGDLLMLAYAYLSATNDTAWVSQYLPLFQKYTDYLVKQGLNLPLQLSTNDAAGPLINETNLAVKSCLGLQAFSLLSGMTNYSTLAATNANILYNQGLGTDANKTHFTLDYMGKPETWKVTFNLYADVLLGLNVFPVAAYEMENTYYPSIRDEGGVAIDDRQWWGKTDWNLWAAGTASTSRNSSSTNATRDMFVNDIWAFVSNGMNTAPFSDRWVVRAKDAPRPVGREFALRARPTVGGHFALLALEGLRNLKW